MKKAFALIELLVAIAIIAILSAIIIPHIAQVESEKGEKSSQVLYVEKVPDRFEFKTLANWTISYIKDTQTGREFLTHDNGGFIEITPNK